MNAYHSGGLIKFKKKYITQIRLELCLEYAWFFTKNQAMLNKRYDCKKGEGEKRKEKTVLSYLKVIRITEYC